MKNYKVILFAFLLGITVFSVFRYLASLKEKYDLLNDLHKTKEREVTLLNEKQKLLQTLEKQRWLRKKLMEENSIVRADIKSAKEKMVQLSADFSAAQETIDGLNSQISVLKSENSSIQQEKDKLGTQLTQAIQEKDALQVRLTSIIELKKAIRELKKQKSKVNGKSLAEVQTKTEEPRKQVGMVKGNRGFLLKSGKSTYPSKAKIEVNLFAPTP